MILFFCIIVLLLVDIIPESLYNSNIGLLYISFSGDVVVEAVCRTDQYSMGEQDRKYVPLP